MYDSETQQQFVELRRQIVRATGGDAPFTAPVGAIPAEEYHEHAQDWVA